MRILFTNNALALRTGSVLYVKDLASVLCRRGIEVSVYSPVLGEVADELRREGVTVCHDLAAVPWRPDVIHGHHHLETMSALLRFRGVPAVFVSHGWTPWEEIPPLHPRILRYVAVDGPTRDAAVRRHGVPADRVRILPNFVDLERFRPRSPLPPRPGRALVYSNYASEETHLPAVREACARKGIALDVIGLGVGRCEEKPEKVLGEYDLVFAKGRAALEAVAAGAAVVVCDVFGVGPMISTGNMKLLYTLEGDYSQLYGPLGVDRLLREIDRYDAADAGRVSAWARSVAGLDPAASGFLALYREVLEESTVTKVDAGEEAKAEARYLAWISDAARASRQREQDLRRAGREAERLQAQNEKLALELQRERDSLALRCRQGVLRMPVLGPVLHRLSGSLKARRPSASECHR